MRLVLRHVISPLQTIAETLNPTLLRRSAAKAVVTLRAAMVVCIVWCCVFGVPRSAHASRSLDITKFEMRATELTEEPVGGDYKFTNEPVPFTQAGGHPDSLTTTLEFASEEVLVAGGKIATVPTRDVKDVVVDLPPGLLGNPMAVPRCSLTMVTSGTAQCPGDTQVGVYRIRWQGGKQMLAPIVAVTPEAGQSAEFAFENNAKIITPLLTGRLVRREKMAPTEQEQRYGFAVTSNDIPLVSIVEVETTFWGNPADPSHDPMRGRFCATTAAAPPGAPLPCQGGDQHYEAAPVVPFLTWPTDCNAGPETATVRADAWEEPGAVSEGHYDANYRKAETTLAGVTGCDFLQFNPELAIRPDTVAADEPVGIGLDLKVPLNEKPEALATPQLRNTVVTLPEGLSVSPGIVDGIRACEPIGPEGINIDGPLSEEVGLNGELQLAPGHCPDASIVGSAEAVTPFLPEPVKGHLYLAQPGCGGSSQPPCTERDALDGNLYRLYLELGGTGELARTGVHFKVPLETTADLATGQLTARTLGTPQAPFSELVIHLNGGPRAPLANPATCGTADTFADLTPWSAPGRTPEGLLVSGTPDATPSSFYKVEGCSSPPPFSPGFTAGTVTPQAGQFSSFTLNLTRLDREQYVKGIQVHAPPGLIGMLSSVPLCEDAGAEAGSCPPASKIGTTRVASGAGSHPFEIEGEVFLTGPHDGAPFGLSVVTHVVAGPFNLGVVVVRARIDVDKETSTLTVTTDETGPHAIPQIVFGVPLRLKRVTVNIDRPNFMFNPTNCSALKLDAVVAGDRGAVANVSSPFAVGGCRSLAFKPRFSASVTGRTSRLRGAGLDVKLAYPTGSLGSEANVASVKVSLPKQLPSRLSTLQQACPAATFAANPSACPRGSVVGIVRATTPVLPVGLLGPVYFVSHGGEAFPSLIVVLQGDGVRVDLRGTTFINEKTNITSSTFKALPDVPVSAFELFLPQGPVSALAANGDLCKQRSKLVMPTSFVAQDGAKFKQSTRIAVTGCGPARAKGSRARGVRGRGRGWK